MTTPKRRLFWVDTLHANEVASAGQTTINLVGSFDMEQTRLATLTVMRIIVCHDYHYTVHDAGEGSLTLDVGIGISSQEAFAAGILADPATTQDFPIRGWLYRCRHVLHGFAADQPAVDVRSVNKDLRARRKLDNGVLHLILDNTPASGVASTARITGITRVLFAA